MRMAAVGSLAALSAHAAAATAASCSWIENTDYYGATPSPSHGGVNLTRQGCCELCKATKDCDFAIYGNSLENPPKACWFKKGPAPKNVPGYKYGATICCPAGMVCPQASGVHVSPSRSPTPPPTLPTQTF